MSCKRKAQCYCLKQRYIRTSAKYQAMNFIIGVILRKNEKLLTKKDKEKENNTSYNTSNQFAKLMPILHFKIGNVAMCSLQKN